METNVIRTEEDYDNGLQHYGIKRRSGRYPWGSGDSEYQRSKNFRSYVDEMKAQGLKPTEIAKIVDEYAKNYDAEHGVKTHYSDNFTTTNLRAATANATEIIRNENVARATRMREKGMSPTEISETMGLGKTGESTVRGWLKVTDTIKENSLRATAERLKEEIADKEFLDVGKATHLYMGVSSGKLNDAVASLRDEGYNVYSNLKVPQLGTGKNTTYKVLTHPGVTWHEAKEALLANKVRIPNVQSDDGGHTYFKPKDLPVSVDLKRVSVKWAEDGGREMDGVIELRRGVDDISLGKNNYAQVRIAVDGTHYLKGMAIYADDLPKGVDLRFNTNKTKADTGGDKLAAMKPLKQDKSTGKVDAENPFGANTKPRVYVDAKGKEHTSPLNLVNEEGTWDTWSRTLSSQMLSKQSLSLAKTQLDKAATKRADEFGKIMGLTNQVVKEKLLQEFADSADAAAVHLKAASIPRQVTSVILPLNSMRPHEIYAPQFKNGEKVVLIRHPHGGPFEIPELTVNNSNAQGKRILQGALDAVGIHHSVAEQLSGADFDGDSVLVIPNNNRRIKTAPQLAGLKNFDPKTRYKIADDDTVTKRMTKQDTQREMGRISNLITDMTIHGADETELARAVRHSMVVIDAEKHGLDYKTSEKLENIKQLKQKYQGKGNAGASTIISRASSDASVPKRRYLSGKAGIDPLTGKKVYEETGQSYLKPKLDKNGNPTGEYTVKKNITKGTKMEFVDDARELLSGGKPGDKVTSDRGQPMERIYADYANQMKGLANSARKAQLSLHLPDKSKTAASLYSKEVESLKAKLKLAQRNAPLERQAQVFGHALFKARTEDHPEYDSDDLKKIRNNSLQSARDAVGAGKKRIGDTDPSTGKSTLTDREWEAIQAGAVSKTFLREVLRNANMDRVRELSSPRPRSSLSSGQLTRAKQMAAAGRSVREIAEALDIPTSTVADNLRREV